MVRWARGTCICSNMLPQRYWSYAIDTYVPLSKTPSIDLKPNGKHQPVPKRDDNAISDDTTGNTPRDEVPDAQVSLSGLRVFHHDGSY